MYLSVSLPVSDGEGGGVVKEGSCGLGRMSGGVESPVMEQGPIDRKYIHLARRGYIYSYVFQMQSFLYHQYDLHSCTCICTMLDCRATICSDAVPMSTSVSSTRQYLVSRTLAN